MTSRACIVLVRIEMETVVAGSYRHDLGEAPKLSQIARARALVWLRSGDDYDLEKAKVFATREGYQVRVYPTTERDPLGRAKTEALRAA